MSETQKHICSDCKLEFDTHEAYLEHTCEKTGFKPTDPKHLGKAFESISKVALERGQARKDAEAGVEPQPQVE